MLEIAHLADPVELPCGVVLKNRIAKSAMSDVMADGAGGVTDAQVALYMRWADGGLGLSMIGEVQSSPALPEDPGNLVLDDKADLARFKQLALSGTKNGAALWPQLGNAGALADSSVAVGAGPSAIKLGELQCRGLSLDEVRALPDQYASTARLAREAAFSGVQVHAGHGFLVNQFLSPLFNRRTDAYGGEVPNRARLLLEILEAVREAVGSDFPIGVKLNSTDLIEGGFEETDALQVVELLSQNGIDLIEVSGGTYVPGVKPLPRPSRTGPYFARFAAAARERSAAPIMLTGGIKTRADAIGALSEGACDIVGVARPVVLNPSLADAWLDQGSRMVDPEFPKLAPSGAGSVTAWYQRRLRDLAEKKTYPDAWTAETAQADLLQRHKINAEKWIAAFSDRR